jgi:ankyrin repeat protein
MPADTRTQLAEARSAKAEGRCLVAQLSGKPNLEWLRKQAKHRLRELRTQFPKAQLAHAQFDLAKDLGFTSWRDLKEHIDSMTIEGRMIVAAKNGDAKNLAALLDANPDKMRLSVPPYDATLLHAGARHLNVVDLLLKRGCDPNAREKGDNTYAIHWAAAAGALDVVKRLADAGGDVVGHGDDHEMEVIGWASCWEGTETARHGAVRDFLISRGAKHHIFSAVAIDAADEVRRIVAENPAALSSRQSRNENNRTPLQFAVGFKRPRMVALLIELGADPLGVDGWGMPVAAYADTPEIDRPVMEKIRALTDAELLSAARGSRAANVGAMDLVASLALGDHDTAERLLRENPRTVEPSNGVLHLMAKRGDPVSVTWLIAHGANPNGRWAHWDSEVAPLHLSCLTNHPSVARALLEGGADPSIKDTKHESDALGWAKFFGRDEIIDMLKMSRM